MPYDSLRPYLDRLEKENLVRWIDREVDKDWEISAIGRMIFRGMPEERRYGFGFRNIKNYPRGRVVSGVIAASTRMMSVALECDSTPAAIHERTIRGLSNPVEPVIVSTGPCKEVIHTGSAVDLNKLPVPTWTPEKDAGPYLTPLWVTKDPDNGVRNIGIRRGQVKGPTKTAFCSAPPIAAAPFITPSGKRAEKPCPPRVISAPTRCIIWLHQVVTDSTSWPLREESAARRSSW
jgi:4-hydroxy-3-polyprenylbenzoate decarboxylase